jgi:serine protease AprX
MLALLSALCVATGAAGTPAATAAPTTFRTMNVIVRGRPHAHLGALVRSAGGTVATRLPMFNSVAAHVSMSGLLKLQTDPAVLQVTPNGSVGFDSTEPDPTLARQRVQKVVRSDKLWSEGVTGRGVTVALLDTGVYSEHPDLEGRVVHCEDFSHEAGTVADCADTFGHGTFMAGLIAGNGASSNGDYKGAAPEAKIVSVKLAGFDGASDVAQVLAGIQWVVSHKSTYDIRVMNLSLGTDSAQTYLLSPLNYAVEKAWKAGIVVVVSAGNSGSGSRTVLKPADDPFVVTVGASDDEGTLSVTDDQVPVFSSKGPTRADGIAKPDLVAPGVHTVSLRSPGSAIDQAYGQSAAVGDSYFRGTGTSMSAATATGIAAQIIQAQPSLVPDQVKYRMVNTSRKIATTDKYSSGAGEVDAYAAARSTSTARANVGLLGLPQTMGTGLGRLAPDRASLPLNVTTANGTVPLTGELQPLYSNKLIDLSNPLGLLPWLSPKYATTGWDPVTWGLTSWVTSDWAAASWKGESWVPTTLEAASWKNGVWEAASWKGAGWSNADWDAASWKDLDWDAASWKAASWKANNWQTAWYAAAWD